MPTELVVTLRPGFTWGELPDATTRQMLNVSVLRSWIAKIRMQWACAPDVTPETVQAVLSVLAELESFYGEVEA